MSKRTVFLLILSVIFTSTVFSFETCQLKTNAILSPFQKYLMKPSASYDAFFKSDSLPEVKDLSKFYFLEDMKISRDHFAPEKKQRTQKRLRELFEYYIYGYSPELPAFELKTVSDRASVDLGGGVKARIKDMDLVLLINRPKLANPVVRVSLFLPLNADKPPVFLALNKCGNHKVAKDGVVLPRNLNFTHGDCFKSDYDKTHTDSFWNVGYIVSQGYALATLHESDLAADQTDISKNKIHSYYPDAKYSGPHGWRNIAAWAWGLRMTAQALRKGTDVNPKKIITTGHSRRGKAALLAAAFDSEIAMTIPQQSGTWGLALARNHFLESRCVYEQKANFSLLPLIGSQQETITVNNFLFNHWFNDYSENFQWDESKLPIDQHLLLAMMAPRPVLSVEGLQDAWANPDSSYATLSLGSTYYDYQSSRGLIQKRAFTQGEQSQYVVGQLSQVRLPTDHILTLDYWKEMIEFAKKK